MGRYPTCSLVKNQESGADTFQGSPNVTAIPAVTPDEVLYICRRIEENKVSNKAFKLGVKSRPNKFAEFSETGIIPTAWMRQLTLLPKTGKPSGDPSFYRTQWLLATMGRILEREIYYRLLPVV